MKTTASAAYTIYSCPESNRTTKPPIHHMHGHFTRPANRSRGPCRFIGFITMEDVLQRSRKSFAPRRLHQRARCHTINQTGASVFAQNSNTSQIPLKQLSNKDDAPARGLLRSSLPSAGNLLIHTSRGPSGPQ